ncbi:hypothetical protein CTAYLR_000760 [Chrysophaeum taylorii]|uniref:Tubby C-terminal domain-containing protein n=1 Tax=Chrysophaeum taylorii TaxID=2483200 RepID=A0AAD7UQB8_9STRA|nr:hypothetical protein CTAYLR_000760 [Chrysophaeum taylorii]
MAARCNRVKDVVGPIAFEDYAALEEGAAREFIDSKMLTPIRVSDSSGPFFLNDAVQLCKLLRTEKNLFQLYEEASGRHLLSAKQRGNQYYISSYEFKGHFSPSKFSAVVRQYGGDKAPVSYRLYLCVGAQLLNNQARPIIEVWPSSSCCAGQYVRKLRILLPTPTPRGDVSPHYTHDYSKLAGKHSSPTHTSASGVIRLRNKTPIVKNGAYSLKFARGRAKLSSSKNFLVYREEDLRYDADAPSEEAVFQLGKMGSRTFALDFCNPLSPLQAFAIALAAFDSKHLQPPKTPRKPGSL